MKVAFRQVDGTAVLRDEGVRVAVLAAGIVKLEARTAGQPDCRYTFVIEYCREFVQATEAASPEWD